MKVSRLFEFVLAFLFLWGCFSSFIIAILVKTGVESSFVFALKDAVVYLVAFFLLPFWLRYKSNVCLLILVAGSLLYFVVNFLILNPGYSSPINNLRQLVSPLFLLFFFVSSFKMVDSYHFLRRAVLILHTFLFIFGVFELLVGFWKWFGLGQYFRLKGIPVDAYGLSYMFYEPMIGYAQRMTSTLLDPISLGHYFATMFCFCWFVAVYGPSVRFWLLLTSSVGLVLCFSKGAILQVFLMLITFNKRIILPLRLASVFVPVAIVYFLPNKKGLLIHLSGLWQSIITLKFFGYGIGTVGNYAKMFSDDLTRYYELGISDTFLGSLVGQVGLFGLALWFFILFLIVDLKGTSLPLRLLGSIVAVSAMSENTMNVTSFVLPAILITWSYSYYLNDSVRHVVSFRT